MTVTRVLVVDDSAVSREYLTSLIRNEPSLEVIGTANDGQEAVRLTIDKKPDVIVMDLHMPVMDGIEASRQIMKQAPTPIIIATASLEDHEVRLGFQAIEAGALTIMEKPPGMNHPDHEAGAHRLIQTVKLMAEVKVVRRWDRRAAGLPPTTQLAERRIRVIAIGASTGILIVQHITPGFVKGLAQWLDRLTGLTVKVAERGELIKPGVAYLAPDAAHMGVTKHGRIDLAAGFEDGAPCPSVNHLFRTVSEAYGHGGLGILLTGMGRDGATGLKALHEAGGLTVAQSEDSCTIFGMPGEAVRLGAAQHVLSPAQISELLRSLVATGGMRAHS
jgi:two-component system chemotaxis response regulator CheB